jgi:fibronectin-binding autotransporter adhesin
MLSELRLEGAPITWEGDTSVDFTNGTNWVGGSPPADSLTTDIATFNSTPTSFQPELTGSYSLTGISLAGGTTFTGTGNLIIGASGILTAGTNQISLAKLTLGTNATFSLANTTTLSTEIDTAGHSLEIATNLSDGLSLSNVLLSGTGNITFRAGSFSREISVAGNNTFTGSVAIDRTDLNFTTLANGGVASSFGSGTSDVVLGGGNSTAHITNTGAGGSTARLFKAIVTVNTSPTISINNNGTGALHFTNTGTFGSHTLQLSGSYTGAANTFASVITGAGSMTKTGNSTWALTSTTNSYTGATRVNGGVLIVSSLANGVNASSIGAAANTVGLLEFGGGTLRYEGSTAQRTDRLFTINTSGATLDASGTGSGILQFTNNGALSSGTGGGARVLTLTGTNTGDNLLAGDLGNSSGGGFVSVTKSGTGRWILTGDNA